MPAQSRWYLCVPDALFPFAPGDTIQISEIPVVGAALPGKYTGVVVRRVDPVTQLPTPDEAELWASRGGGLPAMWGIGASFVTLCPDTAEPGCGTGARTGELALQVGSDLYALRAGQVQLAVPDADGAELGFALMHAQQRTVVDPDCALGPGELGLDLEFVGLRVLP